MNNHSTTQKLLTAYALGELNQQDLLQVQAHLAECDACRNELTQMQAVLSIADSMRTRSASESTHNRAAQNIQAVSGRTKTEESHHISWSRIMKSNITKSAAAAMIVIGAFIFLTQTNGTSTAFANAMEHFAAAQTARFDLTIEFGDQEPQTSSFLYDAKGYIRQNMADGTVNFVDYNTNKVLSLLPGEKTAVIQNVKNEDFHTALYDIFTKLQDLIEQVIDLEYGSVESLGTKNINNRTAYGFNIETTGTSPGLFWQGKGALRVWADAQTDFPLILKWHNSMTNIIVTVSNIELNVVFNPDEITLSLPEGCTIIDESIQPEEPKPAPPSHSDKSSLPESPDIENRIKGLEKQDQTLIQFFHSWTALTGGTFPSSLTAEAIRDIDPHATVSFGQKQWSFNFSAEFDLSGCIGDDWKSGIDPNDYTAEEKEQLKQKRGRYYEDLQAALNKKLETIKPCFKDIFEGFEMINDLPATSDWHYNGAGVERGDSQTAVFWYRPEGSTNYRVIFGDLTIEDVTPEDIPLLETSIAEDETDQKAKELLETAIQLGADIPKDKRPVVLRMLSLKENDLIRGLSVWLELLDGNYPDSLEVEAAIKQSEPLLVAKYYDGEKVVAGEEKELKEKTYDLFFASAFYDKLVIEKKDVVYYGNKLTVQDSNQILARWKIKKDRYRVVFCNLTSKTVSKTELLELEKQSIE